MTSIKEKHIKLIMDNETLYKDTPLLVLRHIWSVHSDKFEQELEAVLKAYQDSLKYCMTDVLTSVLCSLNNPDLIASVYVQPRKRRKDLLLAKLVDFIGDKENLYEQVVKFFRNKYYEISDEFDYNVEVFSREEKIQPAPAKKRRHGKDKDKSNNIAVLESKLLAIPSAFLATQESYEAAQICTLRFDILMCLNEAKLDELVKNDPIHKIVWCLDACVRNRKIDQRHASELASHLQRQRSKLHKDSLESATKEVKSKAADDTQKSEKKTKGKRSRDDESTLSDQEKIDRLTKTLKKNSRLEKDLHLICNEPAVVHVIVTSIIRFVLNGLYHDSIPRDIPEVHFLIELLEIGIGVYLKVPPDWKEKSEENEEEESDSVSELKRLLLTRILPAVCHIQVSAWRYQVAEELRGVVARLWGSSAAGNRSHHIASPSATVGSSLGKRSRTSSSESGGWPPSSPPNSPDNVCLLEAQPNVNIPPKWRKKVEDFCNVPIEMPGVYLDHPVGVLLVQYHALFALDRRDLLVLRVLLRGIVVHVQRCVQERKKPTNTSSLVHFQWRPDCLQALVMGVCSLPPTPNPESSSASASTGENAPKIRSPILEHTPDYKSSGEGVFDFELTPEQISSLCNPASSTSVGRQELVSLLRACLEVHNDFELSALLLLCKTASQYATAPGTSSSTTSVMSSAQVPSTGTACNNPSPLVLSNTGNCQRERLINCVAKHFKPGSQTSSCYVTSDSKLVDCFEMLKQDQPLTPNQLFGLNLKSQTAFGALCDLHLNSPTKLNSGSYTSSMGPPAAPTSGGAAVRSKIGPKGLPSSPHPSAQTPSGGSSAMSPRSSSGFPPATRGASYYSSMPTVGTPLTNPGLMAPTPLLNNTSVGSNPFQPTSPKPSE